MYAARTICADTTAVMAAKVELPRTQSVREPESRKGKIICDGAPFHMYFSDAKYDVIGTIPRDRLKMMSLRSTPLL